jgi:CD163 antigen
MHRHLSFALRVALLVLAAITPLRAWEYRIDGDTLSGLLLVRPDNASAWGTVCDDDFAIADALVACRSVITTAQVVSATWRTTGATLPVDVPIWMDDVMCNGTEAALSDCSFTRTSMQDCVHQDDVAITCTTIPDGLQLRLSEGTKGLLEMRPNVSAPWGTVCDRGFTATAAEVVCRELFPPRSYPAIALSGLASFTGGPIYRSDVRCTNASNVFSGCNYTNSTSNCTSRTNAGVVCSDWAFRLDSSVTGLTGRLLARPTNASSWGTICATGFTQAAAMVACRTVIHPGYTLRSASVAFAGIIANYTGLPVWMTNVNCANPSSTNLAACSWTDGADCSHSSDAWLQCDVDNSLFRLPSGSSDIIQMRPNNTAPWGTVCGVGFDSNDAAAVCRELGYFAPQYIASAYNSSSFNGTTTLPTYYSGVRCNATQLFSTCAFDNNTAAMPPACQGANHTSAASVRCPAAPNVWEYALHNPSSNGTFRNGVYEYEGRLIVRPNSWSTWGTVCYHSFYNDDVMVACRSVFPGRTIMYATRSIGGASASGYASYPILMDDIECVGTEQRLDMCAFTGNHDCRHTDDVILFCVLLGQGQAFSYRLVNGSSGMVQVRPNSTAPWGTVCGVGFDSNDAAAVCRELGYSAPQYIASAYNSSSLSSSFNGTTTTTTMLPTYYSDMRCNATQLFTTCAFNDNTAAMPPACQGAIHTSAASVRCSAAPSVWEYELTNNNTGRLLVRPNVWSAWGTVCNTSFDAVDATVACRSVFPDAAIVSATFTSAGTWGYDGWPVYMNDLQCTGSEPRLDSCRQSSNRCDHPNDVLLTCVINSMLRLSNMNSSGIVQVRPNVAVAWGTVCGIGFDSNDATAVCRELGYVAPRYVAVASNGTAIGPTYYSAVRCNETQLFTSCTFTGNATLPAACTDSSHATAARVECREQLNVWEYRLASNTTSGRLQLRPNAWSPWGRLCSVINNAGAWVACRSVFPGRLITSAAYARAEPPMNLSGMPFYTSIIECAGWESQLSLCRSAGSSRDDRPFDTCWLGAGDVVLTCGVPSVFYQLSNVTSGVIQVRPNITAPWGTVCGVGFDSNDAAAVCRELGYSSPQYIASAYNSSSFNGTTMLPTYYSGVRCDATQLFTTCAFDNNTVAMPPACQGVNHTSAASVRCTAAPSVPDRGMPGRSSIVVPVVCAVIGLVIGIIIVFCCVRRHRRLAKARDRLPTPEDVAPADLVTTELTTLGQLSDESGVGAVVAGDGAVERAFEHQGAASSTLLQGEAVVEDASAEAALAGVVIGSEDPRDPRTAVLEGRLVPVEVVTATTSATASADTPSMARLFQERRRWHGVVRGHAAPTTEPFSFTLLREITQNFRRRLATPAEALPAGASVAFLNCADVSHGTIYSCTAAVSAVPSGELADVTRGFAAAAAARPTGAGSACLPLLYGFAVAQEGVRALAQALGMPAPPSGWTLVALLYEASPAASSCAAVCSSSHADEAVTRRAIGWVARSVHSLSTHRILAAAHPHCVSFRGGTALGAPFPTRLWITTRYAVQPGNVLALLVSGLQAWQVLTAMPVLPKAAPAALDTLVGQLEAMGDMHYDWIPQYPFDPDAPCAFDAHFACSACGSVVIPSGLRVALLRCTALQGHYLCASCIIPAASGGNQRMRCPVVEGCSGDLVPSDVAVVQRGHRLHGDHTADPTAAATYSPPELELATAVDGPRPQELSFGGAAVVVVSPDDVDVEPRDADTSVPFLATHCPLDEPEAAADPPPEC